MNDTGVKRYRKAENTFRDACRLDPAEHFIKVEKTGSVVRLQIAGKGPPLLFIHGGPASGSIWYELLTYMQDYTCIVLDRPGCGLSEAVSYRGLSRESLTKIIVSVVDSVLDFLHIQNIPAIASSLGGYLTLLYTIHKPERISKLVLEGCPAMVEGSTIPDFMKAMLYPGLRSLFPILPSFRLMLEMILRKMGHTYSVDNHLISEEFIEWYIQLFNNTHTMKNDLMLASKTLPFGKEDRDFVLWDHEIKEIGQQTLWLWGKNDVFGSAEIGNRLNLLMKKSDIVIFENAGHLPWIDSPQDHASGIKDWLMR